MTRWLVVLGFAVALFACLGASQAVAATPLTGEQMSVLRGGWAPYCKTITCGVSNSQCSQYPAGWCNPNDPGADCNEQIAESASAKTCALNMPSGTDCLTEGSHPCGDYYGLCYCKYIEEAHWDCITPFKGEPTHPWAYFGNCTQ